MAIDLSELTPSERETDRFENYRRYQKFFYKRLHWIKENYSKSDQEEDKKLIDFNDELISNIESAYNSYNKERHFVIDKLASYDNVIKEGVNLENVIKNAGGGNLVFDSVESIKEKASNIRRYMKLASVRENEKLTEREEKEIANLISLNISEITNIENKYQEFLNYNNKMLDILKNKDSEEKNKTIDDLALTAAKVSNDDETNLFLKQKNPKYDIYMSYVQNEKHPALDRAIEETKKLLNGQKDNRNSEGI